MAPDVVQVDHGIQAGKDVKENLKNWAKQQEAELASDPWHLKVARYEPLEFLDSLDSSGIIDS